MKHIVLEMTINGIVDLVFVFNHGETREVLDATRDFIAAAGSAKSQYKLTIVSCECDNPNSHKDRVGSPA